MNQITVATSTWQPVLFADLPAADLASTSVMPPKRPARYVPHVTGGLFELVDTVSPNRFRACYHSGASAYFDTRGLIDAGKDVGVDATIVQPRVIALLQRYAREGGKVFVDSGAYGASQRYEADWNIGHVNSGCLFCSRLINLLLQLGIESSNEVLNTE